MVAAPKISHKRLRRERISEAVGDSNGGKAEGGGVFEGKGWQPKGSVGGGSYRQPKKVKRKRWVRR